MEGRTDFGAASQNDIGGLEALFFASSELEPEITLWRCVWFPKMSCSLLQVKELPTLKDMDFLNKNQKVYIGEEEKKVFLEKLKRDVEVMVGCSRKILCSFLLLPG